NQQNGPSATSCDVLLDAATEGITDMFKGRECLSQLVLLHRHLGFEHFKLACQTAEGSAYVGQKGRSFFGNLGLVHASQASRSASLRASAARSSAARSDAPEIVSPDVPMAGRCAGRRGTGKPLRIAV
ncbi:hypothetical protein AC629_42845, partial [Bradyrhizobium sp. NAS80.1]|uniref:hypothetical protein n=1 Tax=Bradyrhizobium sp. NAS80.1 TaxID=1680159 RepID=UPI00095EB317